MAVLVTGGAGYIGSHTVVEMLNKGYDVVIVDNFCNSSPKVLERITELTGKTPRFYEADIRDREAMDRIFDAEEIDAVIHFAALKAVGESVEKPLEYFENNISGTILLCEVMQAHGVKKIIYSSSATVYGDPASVPIREDFPLSVTNPYGRTKLVTEMLLEDWTRSDPTIKVILLRYFNPVGAHISGRIGEAPNGIPNNLTPYITQVAVGKRPFLNVFGDDYDTPDGTGVRDYIHVVDLALGHISALERFDHMEQPVEIFNLGTGRGYSVLEVVEAFRKATGKEIPYKICPRRPGDIAECYADPSKALAVLGWKAERGIDEMCADSWRWQRENPDGYGE